MSRSYHRSTDCGIASNQHTFEVLPRRWLAGQTLAWITSYRRCARDYERLPAHHEAAVYWAMITIITRRLAGEARRS
jgi:transposase